MAVNIEERKAVALEELVQVLEHQVYHDNSVVAYMPDGVTVSTVGAVLSARHTADCVGCAPVRTAAIEKAKADAEAKAKADAEVAHAAAMADLEKRQKAIDDAVAAEKAAADAKAKAPVAAGVTPVAGAAPQTDAERAQASLADHAEATKKPVLN